MENMTLQPVSKLILQLLENVHLVMSLGDLIQFVGLQQAADHWHCHYVWVWWSSRAQVCMNWCKMVHQTGNKGLNMVLFSPLEIINCGWRLCWTPLKEKRRSENSHDMRPLINSFLSSPMLSQWSSPCCYSSVFSVTDEVVHPRSHATNAFFYS